MYFNGGKVQCSCADISWIIYKISSCSESCPVSLFLMRSDITYCSHAGCVSILWFVLVEEKLYCVCSRMFFYPWYKWPSSLHNEFVHTSASVITRSLYPKILPEVSQLMWFAIGSTVIVYFLGYM